MRLQRSCSNHDKKGVTNEKVKHYYIKAGGDDQPSNRGSSDGLIRVADGHLNLRWGVLRYEVPLCQLSTDHWVFLRPSSISPQ